MSSEDYISYVKTFLKKHECPLLNFMPLEEVFDATNMSVLVSWAFCLWHKDRFETKLVNRAYDKAFIAELIDCFGFCSDLEEAQRFLNAEQTPEEQIFVMYGMFKFMEPTLCSRLADEQESISITNEDLDNLECRDVNLFPEFGKIVSLTDQQREEILKSLDTQLNKLSVDETVVSNGKLPPLNTNICNADESLLSFEQSMSQFKRLETLNTPPKFAVDDNFGDVLKYCNSSLQDLAKYLDDVKTIQQFKVKDLELPEDDISHYVSALYQNLDQNE